MKTRKHFFLIFLVILLMGCSSVKAQTEEIQSTDVLHLILTVKWGNVLEEPINKEAINFNGSISLSGSEDRITLIKEMLFEKHNEDQDKIISKSNPVSWQSLIFKHWDGVRVLVSGSASSTLVVETVQGSLTKTVKEVFEAKKPIVEDLGNGYEIVIHSHPSPKRVLILKTIWGGSESTSAASAPVDFSGEMTVSPGNNLKLLTTLRFEKNQGDKIVSQETTKIKWQSKIYQGQDGLLSSILLNRSLNSEHFVTIKFTDSEVNWQKTYPLSQILHEKIVKEEIPVGERIYQLVIALHQLPNKKLIKVRNKPDVYLLEDGLKKPIISAEVFKSHEFNWSEIETVSEEELDSYAEGEVLNYPDGTLVKGSKAAVYVISEGRKKPIRSAEVFSGLGYKWENIKTIKDAELNQYEPGPINIRESSHPEGALLRVKGTAGVYQVRGGKLRPIQSKEIFEANKLKWREVLEVTNEQKNKIEIGKELSYPDGTLIKTEGAGVYLIEQGEKRPIKSADDFQSLNYKWRQIKTIPAKTFNALPVGRELIGR